MSSGAGLPNMDDRPLPSSPPVRVRSPPQRGTPGGGGHSPRHPPGALPPPPPPSGHDQADWETKEDLRQRQLEEARSRAAQMEKTMRWWSDCTANWREKWAKVRTERNRAQEEIKRLRGKLENAARELMSLRKERQEAITEVDALRGHVALLERERSSVCSSGPGSDHEVKDSKDVQAVGVPGNEDFVNKLLQKKDLDMDSSSSKDSEKSERSKQRKVDTSGDRLAQKLKQKVKSLEIKLDESQRLLMAEKEEKTTLQKSMDEQKEELNTLKLKQEELKQLSDGLKSKVNANEIRKNPVLDSDLEDEDSREDKKQRLEGLHRELENLQSENASEYEKREQLETEKLELERENKKLRTMIDNLQEELNAKTRQTVNLLDTDVKTLQFDLSERNKELSDLRLHQHKLKKLLGEKTAELEHSKTRADQYETEVKKLRTRIDELKRERAAAEDEVDQQGNTIRRLQRTNDELEEQREFLQMQVDHLQTRLRRSNSQPSLSGHRASSLKSFDMHFDHDAFTSGASDTEATTDHEDLP